MALWRAAREFGHPPRGSTTTPSPRSVNPARSPPPYHHSTPPPLSAPTAPPPPPAPTPARLGRAPPRSITAPVGLAIKAEVVAARVGQGRPQRAGRGQSQSTASQHRPNPPREGERKPQTGAPTDEQAES